MVCSCFCYSSIFSYSSFFVLLYMFNCVIYSTIYFLLSQVTVGRRIIEKSKVIFVVSSLEKLMIMKMVVENILMMKARRTEIGMMINWKNVAGFLFFLLPFSGVYFAPFRMLLKMVMVKVSLVSCVLVFDTRNKRFEIAYP